MKDLVYTQNGFFTHFIPQTKEGEKAYNEIYRVVGDGAVRNDHLKATLKQLRDAGYTVGKARVSKKQRDEVFTELDSILLDELFSQ